MVSVEQLIGNLLLRHNCVIIPSFGGFVAQPVSARIDYDKGTMLPPGKSLLFNRQLINNDGLLVSEYAQANHVTFDDAAIALKTLVKSWNESLQNGGRIEIEQVGNLFFDEERNICFEQDRFCNLLLESFGLGTVHFLTEEDVQIAEQRIAPLRIEKQLEKESEAPLIVISEDAPVLEQAPIIEMAPKTPETETPVQQEQKRRPWRYVAAACLLPIAFYSIWIPSKTDVLESGVISFKDFNPFHQPAEGSYEQHELRKDWKSDVEVRGTLDAELDAVEGKAIVYAFKFTDDTYIKVALPDKTTNEVVTPIDPKPSETPKIEANASHYIVGCFGDKSNAENLVAKLRSSGLDARILDVSNGLHRVTAGGAISEESYETVKLKADALGFSGWRLH